MFKQLGFTFNTDECIGCKSCEIACKNEHQTAVNVQWRRVYKNSGDMYLSISCNHCENPECFRICPESAFTKRKDGIVILDQDLCSSCQLCVNMCPFGGIQFDIETLQVSKCDMCYSRQDKGLQPACVEACPTEALNVVDWNEFHDNEIVPSLPDFPDIHITNPSIAFYPPKPRKRYFLK
ncbi:4Fe-4S dicluster domain-containing protein [Bacillus massiliigorillae]|uniref:4Fe-4S dicluster domain-containing protein n=1 Tax=Bacillus massiliigorillae TaxID=1243664 RepID=UPI00039A72CF|nr:4Fe-4S dicluster domain-containing protein [Bacillus massiliigorillae]